MKVLQIEPREIEPPKATEVLVRMLARPINPSDMIPVHGSYANRILLPFTLGYEGVGIVEDVGSAVSKTLIGKRVLPLRGEGTWQDFVNVPVELIVIVPDEIPDIIAAQLYINPITAWVTSVEKLRLRQGQILLINAGGSAIGHIYAQLSNILGFRLIAVTRNSQHTQNLLELGASAVIDTSRHSLYQTVIDLTNGLGANAAIDSIGGQAGEELAACVRSGGQFINIGLLSDSSINWQGLHANFHADIFHLRHWNDQVSNETWQQTFQQIIHLVENQHLTLMSVKASYDLADIHQALAVVSDQRKGKVLLTSY
nr:zinc-dependent alcohol dehydrogenase family protein [Gracilibacillus alcaliphilus]